ncbi:rRNA pseudouridine synthase [Flavobacterium salilacus subsp. salilacus]|uniref:pseudouridine synthase n=1 Tax=Flavobacterium TaxID=237 RepID=UPI001074A839|nr:MULTISPECIES: pseudouridine synthase [Flavobacterium]KAF2514811.1 rRNA pseudouridine synthase [Flavobacterium salilacus subsp. salilacus]MBE1615467.1 rRNA pseudouridine synthase [Flavobacterium sp. SaA2.13]
MSNNSSRGNTSGRGGNDRKKPGRPKGTGSNSTRRPAASKPLQGKKPFVKKEAAPAPKPKAPSNPDELRLNKYIANSGMCSRRDADIYIQSGNVKVNGEVITEMGHKVKLTDKVEFDGATIMPEKKEYLLLNKPKNFSTAGDEERDLRNVMELVRSATKAKLQPIGRMDKNTTGLLIFTNDADMIRKFSLPNQKSFKIYQVSLDRNLKFEDLEKMSQGVTLDGHRLFIDEVSYIENEPKTEIGIKLRTQNVRVVRAIFESFKYDVIKVDRVSYAGLTKKNLPRGNWRFLTEQEVINLKNI